MDLEGWDWRGVGRKVNREGMAQMVKNWLQCKRPGSIPGSGRFLCRREWLPTPVFLPKEFHGWQIDGETVEADFIFWVPKSLQIVTTAMKLKETYSLEGKL